MLFFIKLFQRKLRTLIDRLQQYIIFCLFVILTGVHRHKSVKCDLGCRYCKPVISGTDLHVGRLIYRRCHTACCKTFPDQLIQAELISGKGIFHHCRCTIDIGWTDGLMCILDFCAGLFGSCLCCKIIFTVIFSDVLMCLCICFLGNADRVCTQVSDKTDRSLSLHIHTFIELLGDSHRL